MKTAIIFFEGKEVCRVEFDVITSFDGIEFNKKVAESNGYKLEVVDEFPRTYGYVLVDYSSTILTIQEVDCVQRRIKEQYTL